MFENIKDFKRIVVSGPQRSGTRITAKIIAHENNRTYIDEKDIAFHDFRLLEYYLTRENIVIQCPGLCHLLHEITVTSTLILVVRRPVDEIVSSEQRIGWSEGPLNERSRLPELYKYGCSEGVISRIKYDFWDRFQKPRLGASAAEVNYHDLESHPLFIQERKHFKWDQIR